MSLPVRKPLWFPKLTGYRVLVLTLSVGLGTSKIVLTYCKTPIASVTLEWIFTVVLGLAVFWLGLYERDHVHVIPWLFERDYGRELARLIGLLRIPVPHYRTDERPIEERTPRQSSRPPLTGYHLLVNFFVVSFGLSKAILAYRGFTTAPDVLDWMCAVVVSIGLYYLGLYENSSTYMWPAMFERDYGRAFSKSFLQGLAESKFFPYTLGLVLASAASYGIFVLVAMIPADYVVAYHNSLELWSWRIFIFIVACVMGLGLLGGIISALVLLLRARAGSISPIIKRRLGTETLDKAVLRPSSRVLASVTVVLHAARAAIYVFVHILGISTTAAIAIIGYECATILRSGWGVSKYHGFWSPLIDVFVPGLMGMGALLWASACLLLLRSLFRPAFRGIGNLLHHVCDAPAESPSVT